MILEQLTPEQRDAAAEYGLAALAFMTGKWAITPDPVWKRYRSAKARLLESLGGEAAEPPRKAA